MGKWEKKRGTTKKPKEFLWQVPEIVKMDIVHKRSEEGRFVVVVVVVVCHFEDWKEYGHNMHFLMGPGVIIRTFTAHSITLRIFQYSNCNLKWPHHLFNIEMLYMFAEYCCPAIMSKKIANATASWYSLRRYDADSNGQND